MGLDEEFENIEDGAETEAERIDQETELLDVEEFQDDEEFDPNAQESDLEDAYEGFFAEEGPDGEGETSPEGYDGGLAAVVERAEGIDLSEEGFHLVDGDELADEADEASIMEPSDEDDGYELVELELDDDDIVRYLEDEDGEAIGFVLLEDGEEVEYFYVESGEDEADADEEDNPYDLGITKEGVAEATQDVNAIYKDGVAIAAELKGAFDDIKSALDFSFLKK
ncbi:hypothetical protein [Arabiibacter massiliensis]|uniref:hypothetical protein n=1 Tax=Arabiibacter massiliensis TaxID=1870985 RepID=UPI0009BA2048|nr:hypothetical protein [Arabiibacter massiliensis]